MLLDHVERERDVLGGERLAVVPLHAVADGEDEGLRVGPLVARWQPRDLAAAVVLDWYQRLEHVARSRPAWSRQVRVVVRLRLAAAAEAAEVQEGDDARLGAGLASGSRCRCSRRRRDCERWLPPRRQRCPRRLMGDSSLVAGRWTPPVRAAVVGACRAGLGAPEMHAVGRASSQVSQAPPLAAARTSRRSTSSVASSRRQPARASGRRAVWPWSPPARGSAGGRWSAWGHQRGHRHVVEAGDGDVVGHPDAAAERADEHARERSRRWRRPRPRAGRPRRAAGRRRCTPSSCCSPTRIGLRRRGAAGVAVRGAEALPPLADVGRAVGAADEGESPVARGRRAGGG